MSVLCQKRGGGVILTNFLFPYLICTVNFAQIKTYLVQNGANISFRIFSDINLLIFHAGLHTVKIWLPVKNLIYSQLFKVQSWKCSLIYALYELSQILKSLSWIIQNFATSSLWWISKKDCLKINKIDIKIKH